jgi:hypothetical protein
MPQTPALVLSILLATTYAVLFYLLQGRGCRDLVLFWLASAVGFASGQLIGTRLNLIPWAIGQVHIVEATLVAFLFLVIARWIRQEKKTS